MNLAEANAAEALSNVSNVLIVRPAPQNSDQVPLSQPVPASVSLAPHPITSNSHMNTPPGSNPNCYRGHGNQHPTSEILHSTTLHCDALAEAGWPPPRGMPPLNSVDLLVDRSDSIAASERKAETPSVLGLPQPLTTSNSTTSSKTPQSLSYATLSTQASDVSRPSHENTDDQRGRSDSQQTSVGNQSSVSAAGSCPEALGTPPRGASATPGGSGVVLNKISASPVPSDPAFVKRYDFHNVPSNHPPQHESQRSPVQKDCVTVSPSLTIGTQSCFTSPSVPNPTSLQPELLSLARLNEDVTPTFPQHSMSPLSTSSNDGADLQRMALPHHLPQHATHSSAPHAASTSQQMGSGLFSVVYPCESAEMVKSPISIYSSTYSSTRGIAHPLWYGNSVSGRRTTPPSSEPGDTTAVLGNNKPNLMTPITTELQTSSMRQTATLHRYKDRDGNRFINGYRILREIGRGSCGKVNLAVSKEDGRHVAIKYVRRAENKRRIGGPTAAQMNYNAFMREVAVMKKLRHKNIVSVYEVIDDPDADKMYLVMQYVDHGPIAHIEVTNGTDIVCDAIPPGELAGYAQQMLAGLEYLHRHNVVHRDIKPDNILVDKSHCVYLADFGVAETFDTQYRERMERRMMKSMAQSMAMSMAGGRAAGPLVLGPNGTMLFIAPELWAGARIPGKPVDMWAMGVTLYTLLTGTLPFSNLDEIRNPNLPIIPTAYGSKWGDLLQGLLNRDPHHRLTAAEARAIVKEIPRAETSQLMASMSATATEPSFIETVLAPDDASYTAGVAEDTTELSGGFWNLEHDNHSTKGDPEDPWTLYEGSIANIDFGMSSALSHGMLQAVLEATIGPSVNGESAGDVTVSPTVPTLDTLVNPLAVASTHSQSGDSHTSAVPPGLQRSEGPLGSGLNIRGDRRRSGRASLVRPVSEALQARLKSTTFIE